MVLVLSPIKTDMQILFNVLKKLYWYLIIYLSLTVKFYTHFNSFYFFLVYRTPFTMWLSTVFLPRHNHTVHITLLNQHLIPFDPKSFKTFNISVLKNTHCFINKIYLHLPNIYLSCRIPPFLAMQRREAPGSHSCPALNFPASRL